MPHILASSRRTDFVLLLTCNAATYFFQDIRFLEGQNFEFWGSLEDTAPKTGEATCGTHMYHSAKFPANRCHRGRDICQKITANLISDKARTSVVFRAG